MSTIIYIFLRHFQQKRKNSSSFCTNLQKNLNMNDKTRIFNYVGILKNYFQSSATADRIIHPQKHSRTARLERIALLLASSPQRLALSATGGVSLLRPSRGSRIAVRRTED